MVNKIHPTGVVRRFKMKITGTEAIEKAFKLANYINSMSQWDLDNTFPTVEIEM